MTQIKYLALLRGINVGGKNLIKMADLKTCFEKMGFSDVKTYIQSGNVLFTSPEKNKSKLTEKLEAGLAKNFNYPIRVVLITHQQLKEVVKKAPTNFGQEPDKYRYDVIFLKEPINAQEAIKNVRIKEGVDQADGGKSVLYFSRLISKATQSYLNKIIALPIYKEMTIRNWNSTTKLLALMD